MKKLLLLFVASAGLLGAAGCTTLTPDPVPAAVPPDGMESDLKSLQEWRQEVRLEQESQAKEIEDLRRQVKALETELSEFQQSVRVQFQDLEAGRERDRKYIIDELTKKLSTLQSAATPTAAGKGGYEHVVQSGQTLSIIAKEYKVSMDAILKANNLKNANQIRVGQKLFIPD